VAGISPKTNLHTNRIWCFLQQINAEHLLQKFNDFLGLECTLKYGKCTKGPYSEPVECSSNFHIQFLQDAFYRFNSHLRLGLSVLCFRSKLSGGNEPYEFSVPASRAAFFAHIMGIVVIALKVFVEEYEL